MTDLDPLAQLDVQRRLDELVNEARRLTVEHTRRVRDHYEATRAYKLAYARAYLTASGTVAEREARALLACEEQYVRQMNAEGLLKSAQEASRNIRAQIEAHRTLAADIRDAVHHSSGVGA